MVVAFSLTIIALFFFVLTRGALLMRKLWPGPVDEKLQQSQKARVLINGFLKLLSTLFSIKRFITHKSRFQVEYHLFKLDNVSLRFSSRP